MILVNKKILKWVTFCGVVYVAAQYFLVLGPIYSIVGNNNGPSIQALETRSKIVFYIGLPLTIVVMFVGVRYIKNKNAAKF